MGELLVPVWYCRIY